MEAFYRNQQDQTEIVAGAAIAGGEVLRLPDGRAGFKAGLDAAAINDVVAMQTQGIVDFAKASATVFAVGDEVWFDASANQAVKKSLSLDYAADLYLGICIEAAVSGDTKVLTLMNVKSVEQAFSPGGSFEFIFLTTGGDTGIKNLIPASANKNGFLIVGIYGVVTEVFAGAGEDQGILQVEDTDGTDLVTITVADAGADVVGDVRLGHFLYAQAAGAPVLTVPAGKGVQAFVSQQTSGAGEAGKIKAYVDVRPLI